MGENIVLFGSLVLIIQGVVGFPIASFLCKKEATRIVGEFKEGNLKLAGAVNASGEVKKAAWKIIPATPEK